MKKKNGKRITTDELARMVQSGFSELKSDLKNSLVSKKEFSEFQGVVLDQFRLLNAEVKSINTTLGPTVVIVAEQERRIQTLEYRLERVEHKVGIVHMKA